MELVGIAEIAELARTSRQVVTNWRNRRADFPKPVADLASGPVFLASDIRKWIQVMNRDASETCPICLGYAERGRDRDYGDKKQIRCERCGAYQISGTALAMLSRRFDDDPLARARFSHAVRMHSDHEEWFMVVSTHVDNFANRPLPSITEQAHLLVKWIAQKLKDDYLGNIRIESPESLAGFVGVVDGTRVARLVEHCAEGKLIVFDRQKNSVGLTSTGWELAQSA